MEATVRNITISVPSSDVRMAKNICRRMGWTVTPTRPHRKTSYERSREDIAAGRVYEYANLQDFINEIEA